jgi:hypothetical protein
MDLKKLIGRKVPDDIRRCVSCNLRVMGRGDNHGWKGVQLLPDDIDSFAWYCSKDICQKAYKEAVDQAVVNWNQ